MATTSYGRGDTAEPIDAPPLSAADRTRELCRSVVDAINPSAGWCPDNDWRPKTHTTTEKVWAHPVTGAIVRVQSDGMSAGWTVTLEHGGQSEPLFETPTTRSHAFDQAERVMARHVEHIDWSAHQ